MSLRLPVFLVVLMLLPAVPAAAQGSGPEIRAADGGSRTASASSGLSGTPHRESQPPRPAFSGPHTQPGHAISYAWLYPARPAETSWWTDELEAVLEVHTALSQAMDRFTRFEGPQYRFELEPLSLRCSLILRLDGPPLVSREQPAPQ